MRMSELTATRAVELQHEDLRDRLAHLGGSDLIAVDPERRMLVAEVKAPLGGAKPRSKGTRANANRQLADWRKAGILSRGLLIDVFHDPEPSGAAHRARVFCALNRDSVRFARRGENPVARRLARNAADVEGGQRLRDVEEAAREVAAHESAPEPAPDSNWVGYLRALRDSEQFRERVLALATEVEQARADANVPAGVFDSRPAEVEWVTGEDVGLRLVEGHELIVPVRTARAAGLVRLGAPAIVHFALEGDRLELEQLEPGLASDMGYLPVRDESYGPEIHAWRAVERDEVHRGGAVRLSAEQQHWLERRRAKRTG